MNVDIENLHEGGSQRNKKSHTPVYNSDARTDDNVLHNRSGGIDIFNYIFPSRSSIYNLRMEIVATTRHIVSKTALSLFLAIYSVDFPRNYTR